MMASSVVNERRNPAAAAAVVSCKSSASSDSDAGVVRDTCFVKPDVNNTRPPASHLRSTALNQYLH